MAYDPTNVTENISDFHVVTDIIQRLYSASTSVFEKEVAPVVKQVLEDVKKEPYYNITAAYKSTVTDEFEQVCFLLKIIHLYMIFRILKYPQRNCIVQSNSFSTIALNRH